MMAFGGHCMALPAVFAILVSVALLVWVGDKVGNPYRGLGKFFGWLALIISTLILIWSILVCIGMHTGCPMMRGMGEMRGMGMMPMPPPGMATPEAPMKKK